MATNELAAILARRRAKAGGEGASPLLAAEPGAPAAAQTAPAAAAKSSIADRIARLKQQSAAASALEESGRTPHFSQSAPSVPTVQPDNTKTVDTSSVAAAQEAAGLRRASSKIQHLQGSLGINVNPFGRPPGPAESAGASHSVDYQRESIMSTGEEQYGHSRHAMGVAMPGMMGSAIPMPGLAKREFRLPGVSVEEVEGAEASRVAALDDSHTTMNRVAGPKRRGPMRPPPGSFRIPVMAAPRAKDVESSDVLAAEPADVAASKPLAQGMELEARDDVATGSQPAPVYPEPARRPAAVYAPTSMHTSTSTPAPAPVAAVTLQKLLEPEPLAPMKPYEIQDDPYAPTYEGPAELPDAPAGFPSALMANFSMDELVIADQPKPKPSTLSSSHATSAASLFGATSGSESISEVAPKPFAPAPAKLIETPLPAPVVTAPALIHEQPALSTVATPAPIPERPASPNHVPAPAPAVSSSTPTPTFTVAPTHAPVCASTPTLLATAPVCTAESAPVSTPTPAVASVPATGSLLFGAGASAASDDDDSSESDWSNEDDDDDNRGQSLFGGQTAAAKAEVTSSAPILVTPTQSTPELLQAPALSSDNLFGNPSSASAFVPAAAAAGSMQSTPQTSISPAPSSSLFGGAASSSSSSSESDSDDEGGLFGT